MNPTDAPASLDPRAVARALGGEVSGCNVRAPGPGHSARDRSLSIKIDPAASEGFLVNSFAGNDPIVCRDHVRAALGLSLRPERSIKRPPRREAHRGYARDDRDQGTANALRIWREAREVRDTPAWNYLHRRGVDLAALPDCIGDVLRWHALCPWESNRDGCIIALWTDTRTNEPRAIHRRLITPRGESIAHWRALGPTAGCIIRLWPDHEVTQGLVIGEGIETVLVAATRFEHRGTLVQPAWAAGDAGHLARLPILAGIRALTLLVDNDKNGRGQGAADACARRWTRAGREVTRLTPRAVGSDMADLMEVG
jgi:hypothetical protein